MRILGQMAGWTEEGFIEGLEAPVAGEVAPAWATPVSVEGVPWLTVAVLVVSAALLASAGGLQQGLSLGRLLVYGAKATSLILDRGESWRLLVANVLHKDLLHLACNAFVLWNVGGALERAVRPADYLATLIFTALGTTLASAIGADSVSLGASGMAFGVLGASASFGWRRGVRGALRNHFGLRLLPWLLALFAVGLGSSGVDNWGHAGGLAVGLGLGYFLEPRSTGTAFVGEGASRRLAAALGACAATLCLGAFAAPYLPVLGEPRMGPSQIGVRVPIGWRRAGEGTDRISFTNGLSAGFRSTATVWVGQRAEACRGASCGCGDVEQLVRGLIETDLYRLLEAGPLVKLELKLRPGASLLGGRPGAQVDGQISAEGGEARVTAVCASSPGLGSAPVAVVALEPIGAPGHVGERMARALDLSPNELEAVPQSRHEPSGPRSLRRASPVPRLSRPSRGHGLSASPKLSDTKA